MIRWRNKIQSIYRHIIGLSCLLLFGVYAALAEGNSVRTDNVQTEVDAEERREAIRILHIGDSHVKGGPFTAAIQKHIEAEYAGVFRYEALGINGSTYQTWSVDSQIQRIVGYQPDILIVSLGTNDSYTTKFSKATMRGNMKAFYDLIREQLPDVSFIYTTPPASYLRYSRRVAQGTYKTKSGKRRTRYGRVNNYSFNVYTHQARELIQTMAKEQEASCIDLYAYIGDKASAISWLKQGWMHKDHVHYTVPGYTNQGDYVAQLLLPILKEYTDALEIKE